MIPWQVLKREVTTMQPGNSHMRSEREFIESLSLSEDVMIISSLDILMDTRSVALGLNVSIDVMRTRSLLKAGAFLQEVIAMGQI